MWRTVQIKSTTRIASFVQVKRYKEFNISTMKVYMVMLCLFSLWVKNNQKNKKDTKSTLLYRIIGSDEHNTLRARYNYSSIQLDVASVMNVPLENWASRNISLILFLI